MGQLTPQSCFNYVTYIRTTPQDLWQALTDADIIKKWWFGVRCESEWKVGSSWKMLSEDGMLYDSGEVLESIPEKQLTFKWLNEWMPEFRAEGYSLCSYKVEPMGNSVKLAITHSIEHADSRFIASISEAWPMTISNLKSLLETGDVALDHNPRHSD
jgi:uncharacterized protein YndB with AHSA1/START domain